MATQQPTMISYYKNVYDKESFSLDMDKFLSGINGGHWQDHVFAIRQIVDKKERQKAKCNVPLVTVSGLFESRADSKLVSHSGYIAIDIDDIGDEVDGVRDQIRSDEYIYASFKSISGNGLCLIFRIDGDRHADAFEGIAYYLYERYRLVVDQSGKNVSRARYVSYDTDLFHNPKALKFKKYLPKPKQQKISKVVFVQNDFDEIIRQFNERGVNICENYRDWVSVGYALFSQFGESGRKYFHILSSQSAKYDAAHCDRQYNAISRNESEVKSSRATIATIYYFAKINGVETYSERTKTIISHTTTLKKSGLSADAIANTLEKFEGISKSESLDIINQSVTNNVELIGEESIITEVERWLKYNHSLKRNDITRRLEDVGKAMEPSDINTMYLECKKAYEKLEYSLFEKIIQSTYIPSFNPLLDFFKSYEGRGGNGLIDDLFSCIDTPDRDYCLYFGKKWLVSVISAAHGEHSPLMFILAGGTQGTGKTEFFRRLLPKELSMFYAESKLDAGKDDDLLMTQKLIIMDDEMGGKSKRESKKLKEMTSKQMFSLREPYGRGNVDLRRLAVLCGTTNDLGILNDPTGNRRLLPVEVLSIDHERYNRIDKIDLIMEAYNLYKSGFEWRLSKEDIEYLKRNTGKFEEVNIEKELIERYFNVPENDDLPSVEFMTSTEIKVFVESLTNQRINHISLGMQMSRMGFECNVRWIDGKSKRVWSVIKSSDFVVHKPPGHQLDMAGF